MVITNVFEGVKSEIFIVWLPNLSSCKGTDHGNFESKANKNFWFSIILYKLFKVSGILHMKVMLLMKIKKLRIKMVLNTSKEHSHSVTRRS